MSLYRRFLRLQPIFLALGLLVISSCQTTRDSHGIPVYVPNYYWNYYLRGIAYTLVGEWERAVADFETAIGRRKGALYGESREKKRTKTYGLHFLDNYFPHRELGICYYYTQRMADAERELNESLQMLPSSRAKSFLDKVRKARLSEQANLESDPIRFAIASPATVEYVNQSRLRLHGQVSSRYYIAGLTLGDDRQFIEAAQETVAFDRDIRLRPGPQDIVVSAEDLAGKRAEWRRSIIVDVEGPSISVSPSPNGDDTVVVVNVGDNESLSHVTIDGEPVMPGTDKRQYRQSIPIAPPRPVKIEASDRAGNRTSFEAHTGDMLKASIDSRTHYPDNRLADLPRSLQPGRTNTASSGSGNIVRRQASDVRLALGPGIASGKSDTTPPRLRLHPNIRDSVAVTTEYYILDLSVEDSGFMDSVTFFLNDMRESRGLREQKSIKHRFTHTIDLEPGANTLRVIARDWAGNRKEETFTIHRKLPNNQRQDLRMTLQSQIKMPEKAEADDRATRQLMSFMNTFVDNRRDQLMDTDIGSFLDNVFLDSEYPRFNLVERDPETMQRLLLEHELIHSSLADYRTAVTGGKLRMSEWLLKGSISFWGGEDNWVLDCTIVDVSTGVQIVSDDIQFEGFELDHVEFQLHGLIDKLTQQLPLHAAPVKARHRKKSVILPVGKADSLRQNLRVFFIAAEDKDSSFADPVAWEGKWVQGVVKSLTASESLIEILPPEAAESITVGDMVIMR